MSLQGGLEAHWQTGSVSSPRLSGPVEVIVAKDIPYIDDNNRFQTLSLYLPRTAETHSLGGLPVTSLPRLGSPSGRARYHVHIHGGAWRDPMLTAASIEPAVAHAFVDFGESSPISAVASLNYTLTHFPTHPAYPYDAAKDRPSDPSREAVHPQHISDVLHGLSLLRSMGLIDQSYILTGHSCGATIAFQAALEAPSYHGLDDALEMPTPAALIGLNGLYDLPSLVHDLGPTHDILSTDYKIMLSNAFGPDESKWPGYSPARFDPDRIAERLSSGRAPQLAVIDQSEDDQLVPTNQLDRLATNLRKVNGLQVTVGNNCTGKHAAPWQQGFMIWDSVRNAKRLADRL